MTVEQIEDLAAQKLVLGRPSVSVVLAEVNFWRGNESSPGANVISLDALGAVLDELPDVPPRIGDCAELLDETIPESVS